MRATRNRWIGFLFAGACMAAVPAGLPRAHAQGFGPDPYQPYNSQYQQYVHPIAPEFGGAATARARRERGATPFQQWAEEQEAVERTRTDRFGGAGLSYWKVRTDPELDRQVRLSRQRRSAAENPLVSITQKYLAYFSEENPRKRALLLRDGVASEREENRQVANRRGMIAGDDGNAAGREPAQRAGRDGSRPAGTGDRARPSSALRRSAEAQTTMTKGPSRLRLPYAGSPARHRAEAPDAPATCSTAPADSTTRAAKPPRPPGETPRIEGGLSLRPWMMMSDPAADSTTPEPPPAASRNHWLVDGGFSFHTMNTRKDTQRP